MLDREYISYMVAEHRFDDAETGDGPVVKKKGSTVELTSRLLEGNSSWVSREAYGDEENLESDTAKHINEEYTELQEFEAHDKKFSGVDEDFVDVDWMMELEQNSIPAESVTLVPRRAEQWLEVPKIIPQDKILQQTVKQIAGRLEAKLDLAGVEKTASGKVFAELKAQAEKEKIEGNRNALRRIAGDQKKLKDERQLKSIVEKCAAKVEGELQKKMVIETSEIDDHCIKWAVHEGGQLVESWETQDRDVEGKTRSGTHRNIKGSPQGSQARQVWLKMDGRVKVVDLGDETGKEMEEKVRRWMRVEEGMGLYVICEGRRLSWRDLAELGDGKTAEVMIELKGGMSKKKSKKNPWNTPSQSSFRCGVCHSNVAGGEEELVSLQLSTETEMRRRLVLV